MKGGIGHEISSTIVIAPQNWRRGKRNAKVMEYGLEPDEFNSSGVKGAIFRFCARAGMIHCLREEQ